MPCPLIYNGANGEMVSALRANSANDGMGEMSGQWHCPVSIITACLRGIDWEK